MSEGGCKLQLSGGVSKGLAMLTMDQEYVNRFSIRSVTLQQRLLQGVQGLGIGAYEGFLGKRYSHLPLLKTHQIICLSTVCLP